MNKHAVIAANLRAAYIIDKYHYGITCNKCSKEYTKYLVNDFSSFCYDTVCDSSALDEKIASLSTNKTVTCNTTITDQTDITSCSNEVSIIDCGITYSGCVANNFEDNSTIYTNVVTNEETVYFTISSIIINDITYLNTDTKVEINPNSVAITKVNGHSFITNVIDFINSLKLDNFQLIPYYVTKDQIIFETGNTDTFSVTTKANLDGDSLTRGVIITEEGLQSVQLTVGSSYTPVGSLSSPESDIFETGVTCSTYTKC